MHSHKSKKPKTMRALALPDTGVLAFHPKQIAKHPLLPLILGLVATGLGKGMRLTPLLVAIFIFSAWLCYDIWPWAKYVGVVTANRLVSSYPGQLGERARKESENRRKWLNWGAASITFAALCGVVLFSYSLASGWIVARYIADEQAEVFSKIIGTSSTAPNGDPQMNMQNTGTSDINVLGIVCYFRSARYTSGLRLKKTSGVVFNGPILIHGNGDGEGVVCSADNGIMKGFGEVICADMEWRVIYTIPDEPKKENPKKYRFMMRPDTHQWTQIALELPDQNCPE